MMRACNAGVTMGAHAAGIGPSIAVVAALMVL
jgi:hypothetical protein